MSDSEGIHIGGQTSEGFDNEALKNVTLTGNEVAETLEFTLTFSQETLHIQSEAESLISENLRKGAEIHSNMKEIDAFSQQIAAVKQKINQVQIEKGSLDSQCKITQESLRHLKAELSRSNETSRKVTNKLHSEIAFYQENNRRLSPLIPALKSEIGSLKSLTDSFLSDSLSKLTVTLSSLSSQLKSDSAVLQQMKEASTTIQSESQKILKSTEQNLLQIKSTYEAQLCSLLQTNPLTETLLSGQSLCSNLISEHSSLLENIKLLKNQLLHKESAINELTEFPDDNHSEALILERVLSQIKALQQANSYYFSAISSLKQDLRVHSFVTTLQQGLNQGLLKNSFSLSLNLSQQYSFTNSLKRILYHYKSFFPQFIPDKNDPLDIALAEYLSGKEYPLEVTFSKVCHRIYMFGTRKVFIKVEEGNLIVRVGGGFMQIDEFIDVYIATEVSKVFRPPRKLKINIQGPVHISNPSGDKKPGSPVTKVNASPSSPQLLSPRTKIPRLFRRSGSMAVPERVQPGSPLHK